MIEEVEKEKRKAKEEGRECEDWASDPRKLTNQIETIIGHWQGELVKPTAEVNPPEYNMAEEDTFGLVTKEEGRPPKLSEMTKRYPDFARLLCWLPKIRDKKGEDKDKRQEALVATSIDIMGTQQNKIQKKRQENVPAAIMEIKTRGSGKKEGGVFVWPPSGQVEEDVAKSYTFKEEETIYLEHKSSHLPIPVATRRITLIYIRLKDIKRQEGKTSKN